MFTSCSATSRLFYFSNVAVNVFIYAGQSKHFRHAFANDWYVIKQCVWPSDEPRPRLSSNASSRYVPDVRANVCRMASVASRVSSNDVTSGESVSISEATHM